MDMAHTTNQRNGGHDAVENSTPTIAVAPERRTRPGWTPSLINPAWTAGMTDDRQGWYAAIRPVGSLPLVWEVSKLDGESGWTVDAAWRNGLPVFVNGYGSRAQITQKLIAEHAALLEEAIR